MDDRIAVVVIDGSEDSILQFLFRGDADVTQHGARHLGEEALDEIEPGAVLGSEDKGEASLGLGCEPGLSFLGDVRRVIVENDLDRGCWRIGGVELLQEADNSRERCLSSTLAWTTPVKRSMPANKLKVPCLTYS